MGSADEDGAPHGRIRVGRETKKKKSRAVDRGEKTGIESTALLMTKRQAALAGTEARRYRQKPSGLTGFQEICHN
ncbi:hypothetical protein [Ramlibacter sp.]|uniref:hypothetical protein n=1 Tax=Ramlibacter sp. TaxID=1917967 RepID=UPI002FC8F5F3